MFWIWVTAGTLGLGAYLLFCRIEGRAPVREFLFQVSLKGKDLGDLDEAASRRRRSPVVVSLSTIPSRLPFISPTLKSLLCQEVLPERILLHLPHESRREGVEYRVPEELLDLEVIRVVRCADMGPATKLLPALLAADPDQLLVSVDDDRIYRPTLLKDLLAAAETHPDAALGHMGLRVPLDRVDRRRGLLGRTMDGLRFGRGVSLRGSRLRRPREVDILHGYGGVLVRPRFFDLVALADMENAPQAAWTEDDTWFAAHCRAPRLLVPGRPGSFPSFANRGVFSATRLGALNRNQPDPEARNTTVLMRHYSDRWSA